MGVFMICAKENSCMCEERPDLVGRCIGLVSEDCRDASKTQLTAAMALEALFEYLQLMKMSCH